MVYQLILINRIPIVWTCNQRVNSNRLLITTRTKHAVITLCIIQFPSFIFSVLFFDNELSINAEPGVPNNVAR